MSKPDPKSLLARWKQKKAAAIPAARSIVRRAPQVSVPATPGQRRLWILQSLRPGSTFYQYAHRFTLRGPLRADDLAFAIAQLQDRREILRARFVSPEYDQLHIKFADTSSATEYWPASMASSEEKSPASAAAAIQAFTLRPFDLDADAPLFRSLLVKHGPDHYELLLAMHHIIGDRHSLQILAQELFALYTARGKGENAKLPELNVQFADFAVWQARRTPKSTDLDYWHTQLDPPPPPAILPQDRRRTTAIDYRGRTFHRALSTDLSEQLHTFAAQQRTTPNVVFLAGLQLLQLRYGSAPGTAIGIPASLRTQPGMERMTGFLNDTLVFANDADTSVGFAELVAAAKQTTLGALSHVSVPFSTLVEEFAPRRAGEENPFFRTMLVYNAPADPPTPPPGLNISGAPVDLGSAKFDLTLFVHDAGERFELSFEYATQLFDSPTIERLAGHLITLLGAALARPNTPTANLPLLAPDERREVLETWNNTPVVTVNEDNILDLIEPHFTGRADQIAVTDDRGQLTYAELDAASARLARHLHTQGMTPGGVVGLHADRNADILIGILGILRAGGAYLPLDPSYPAERLTFMVTDAACQHVVASSPPNVPFPAQIEVHNLRSLPAHRSVRLPKPAPTSPAYLIYTSGSTGRAKGVVVKQRNLVASTAARLSYFKHAPTAFLLLSSYSFDSSVAGIFWTLVSGGTLVIPPPRAEQDMAGLAGLIERNAISHTLLLPSLYGLLLDQAATDQLGSLRTVMVAGEACPGDVVSEHFYRLPTVELINEYGPTEATVWSTAHRCTPTDAFGPVPIGRPVPGARNYVLDANGQPLPAGVRGELYLAGPGLTCGYYQRPKLTAERFPTKNVAGAYLPQEGARTAGATEVVVNLSSEPNAAHPSYREQRLYRTGDRASYRPDGLLDFHGRIDEQVKIRGYRVEPGEVAAQMENDPEISAAAVVARQVSGERALVGYYLTHDGQTLDDAGRGIRQTLPAYMVPRYFVHLAELPRLPNGKVDRQGLPLPRLTTPDKAESASRDRLPQTDTEQTLARIWADVLNVAAPRLDDNFFDLGGDSLRSIRVLSAARKAGLDLSPSHLFTYPTLEHLAKALDREGRAYADGMRHASILVPLNDGGEEPGLFCVHSGGGHVFFYQPLGAALEGHHPAYALQPETLASGEEAVADSIEQMAASYLEAVRARQPHGPYNLLGTCFSNMVVLEMARQLFDAGERIGQLIMVDSGPGQLEALPDVAAQPVKNLFRQIANADLKSIRRGVYRRIWKANWQLKKLVSNDETVAVYDTIRSLNQIYDAYERHPAAVPITLIRSEEFAERKDKDFHLTDWRVLAPRGLKTYVIPRTTHLELFSQPQVTALAAMIHACLSAPNTT